MKAHLILYVQDQARSTTFYSRVLGCEPTLYAPGMSEFTLSNDCILGLMPISGVQQLVGSKLKEPVANARGPRVELYLVVENPLAFHQRAIEAGAVELSELLARDWGDCVAYSLDPDGHVLAFATPLANGSVEHQS